MTAEGDLASLVVALEQLAGSPLSQVDAEELSEVVAEARAQGSSLDEGALAEVWADPLVHGQSGIDLVSAMMRRAAELGGDRLLE